MEDIKQQEKSCELISLFWQLLYIVKRMDAKSIRLKALYIASKLALFSGYSVVWISHEHTISIIWGFIL